MTISSLVRLLSFSLATLTCAAFARAQTVTITTPLDGATVSGLVTIQGTATDLGNGRVSVSIDGGPFELATGTTGWSFDWDASTAANGAHTITARARQCMSCPEVIDTATVQVGAVSGPAITILTPLTGQTIVGTLTMTGTSSGASEVAVAIDAGAFVPTGATSPWSFVIEALSVPDGVHTLSARAIAPDGSVATDSVSVTFASSVTGQAEFEYRSSVDQALLTGLMYVPSSYTPSTPTALVVFLHGGGGLGVIPPGWLDELEARGWIHVAPDGRNWGLADPTAVAASCANTEAVGTTECNWCTSAAYVDNPFDPLVGPGEQDILDAIDWARDTFAIDPERVYLTGFSMGGRGTYQIGLRNPDRFAAIAPLAPAADMYEVFDRRPDPAGCKEGMVSDGAGGGQPGDSAITDTLYTLTSGRFLIENAFNLPVFHGHGTNDTVAFNVPGTPDQYLHGMHMLMDTSWNGCHDAGLQLCFGHTPTLSELAARHPEGYEWGFITTPVGHQNDTSWATGTPDDASVEGIPSAANPGERMGLFEFFERHTLVSSPATVVYKSYTDRHRCAYWAEIDITTPWQDLPGAIRVTRDVARNELSAELVRVGTATFDLARAGLRLEPATPLSIAVARLLEPAFDPALTLPDTLAPTFVLRGDFARVSSVRVQRDGVPDPAIAVAITPGEVRIGPVAFDLPGTLAVHVTEQTPRARRSGPQPTSLRSIQR